MAVILMKGIVTTSKLEVHEWNRRVDDAKNLDAEEHQGQRGSVGQHGRLQHTLEPIELLLQHRQHQRNQRSEEHTSELQSLRHLVCRLLLEKKKIEDTLNLHFGAGRIYILVVTFDIAH